MHITIPYVDVDMIVVMVVDEAVELVVIMEEVSLDVAGLDVAGLVEKHVQYTIH